MAKKENTKKNRISLWLLLIVIILAAGNIIANRTVFVKQYTVVDSMIPTAFDGYTIMQITDVHSIRNKEQEEMLLNKVKEAEPDLIALTGDLVDHSYYNAESQAYYAGETEAIPGADTIEFVEELLKIADVYYVYGNHEAILLDDVENNIFKRALENIGVVFLNNTQAELEKGDESIILSGIQDPATLYKDEKYAYIDIREGQVKAELEDTLGPLQENAGETSEENSEDKYTILLSHRPEYFELYTEYGVNLVLTGHAHGGQIRLPFIGGMYAPGQGWFPKYTSGYFTEGNTTMVVGRGIGNSTFPVRVFNPPEIIKIVLKHA